jgi:hypothetical protein
MGTMAMAVSVDVNLLAKKMRARHPVTAPTVTSDVMIIVAARS